MKQPIRCFFSQFNWWGACALFAFVALDLGCAKIAGLDDPVDPNSGLCNTYCDTVMSGCPDPSYVYATRDMCIGVCHQLELAGKTGDPKDQSGNTIYCRLYQAQQALSTAERSTCPNAGPGGNNVCGTNCEDYCVLMQATCPTQFADPKYFFGNSLQICISQCAGLPVLDGGFNADLQQGNNIDCRLYHISAANASLDSRAVHCPHAAGEPPCQGPPP